MTGYHERYEDLSEGISPTETHMTPTIRREKREDEKTRYLVYLDGFYATSFPTKKKAEAWVAEHVKWASENN